MRLAVCLPTYDERENIEAMARALGHVFERHGLDGRVLVIDDSSPDGTGAEADRLAAELPFLEVLHRERKEGLGPAYLAGFRRVLREGADLVAEIDCDFSHDPEDLPRLVAAAEEADVALGSRYVPGGGTRNWSLLRRAVSRSGGLYARAVLGIGVRDPTSGFRVYRRPVLQRIALDRISSRGYAFQVETVYRALEAGFTVREVPIVFAEREAGGSKMGGGIVLEAVVRVPALRLTALRGRL
ncbi:MAG: polyprenol monophosphomannose synthase [Gaiellaceae bacterium]